MKVAILGAGYCGLSLAWHLSSQAEVTIFDQEKYGKASYASTGLLHPFLGTRPRLSWNGFTAFQETLDLLEEMQAKSSKKVFKRTGIFKPILYDKQIPDFRKAHEKFEEIEWVSSVHKQWGYQDLKDLTGIWVPDGLTIFSKNYLSVLSDACFSQGVKRVYQNIADLEELQGFDHIVLATGSSSHLFSELQDIQLDRVKGQALLCEWPEGVPPLPMSIIGQGHICMSEDLKTCFIGSTYEHQFDTEEPTDLVFRLKEQIGAYFPPAKDFKVLSTVSGVRIYRKKSHLPLVTRLSEKLWAFTAIGSRGLLYHSFLGKKLALAILENDPSILPSDVQINHLMV